MAMRYFIAVCVRIGREGWRRSVHRSCWRGSSPAPLAAEPARDSEAGDHDREEACNLLNPVFKHMIEAVHRYNTRNQSMGDGIIALVGDPWAHEEPTRCALPAPGRMPSAAKPIRSRTMRTSGPPSASP